MAPKTRPPIERFVEKVVVAPSGCHEWTAYRGNGGYGRFYLDGRGALAHRWAYEHYRGPIPEGLQIDHLCRNRRCVNPDHLEPVTASENVLRGSVREAAQARSARITHCPKGHEYTEENTYMTGGGRSCWTCKRANRRQHYLDNRAAYIARSKAQRERARKEVT